jgi:hypothetical protein
VQLRTQFVQVSEQASEKVIKFTTPRVAQLGTANTPEHRDYHIGYSSNDLQTMQKVARLGTANTRSFEISIFEFIIKHRIQTEF